jgi:hypothetical protein
MEQKAVRYEVDDAVAPLTLDRPHRLNGAGHSRRAGFR